MTHEFLNKLFDYIDIAIDDKGPNADLHEAVAKSRARDLLHEALDKSKPSPQSYTVKYYNQTGEAIRVAALTGNLTHEPEKLRNGDFIGNEPDAVLDSHVVWEFAQGFGLIVMSCEDFNALTRIETTVPTETVGQDEPLSPLPEIKPLPPI